MLVKPKAFKIIDFPGKFSHCLISLCPQQKWEFNRWEGALCTVKRKNIVIEISQEDLDKYFKEWK